MMFHGLLPRAAAIIGLTLSAVCAAAAADYPAPQEGDWVARDFRFHTGEVMQELHLHYTTVGAPSGQPVLILHGTTQSGALTSGAHSDGVNLGSWSNRRCMNWRSTFRAERRYALTASAPGFRPKG